MIDLILSLLVRVMNVVHRGLDFISFHPFTYLLLITNDFFHVHAVLKPEIFVELLGVLVT